MDSSTDWNRTAVRRLIIDAEDALAFLDRALRNADPLEQAWAIRNGRRAYKELLRRQRGYLLTPVAALALEKLLAAIQARLGELREKVVAGPTG